MSTETKTAVNVQQVVPFFWVTEIHASLQFHIEGLGFETKHRWEDEGKLAWCWLQLGEASLMLQELR